MKLIYTGQLEKRKFTGLNLKSLIFAFLQIMVFQYCTFNLSVFKYFALRSNFKDYLISEADFITPTCLYLMQIYTLNSEK